MADAVSDLTEMAADARAYTKQVVRDVGNVYRGAIRTELKRDTGGDFRLSGASWAGRLNPRVSVKQKPGKATTGTVSASPKKAKGPWRWLNDGTRPHTVNGRRHPGTRGKRTWDDPVGRSHPEAQRKIVNDFDRKV